MIAWLRPDVALEPNQEVIAEASPPARITHNPWIGVGSYVVKCSSCRRKNRSPGSRQAIHATQGGTPEPRGEQLRKFKGKLTTLDNAIHALRNRKIFLSKVGERGMYRLQHEGFVFWMKLHTSESHER